MEKRFFAGAYNVYSAFIKKSDAISVPQEYGKAAEIILKKIGWQTKVNTFESRFTVSANLDNNKVLLAFSGGLDSTYLLFKLIEAGFDVTACHVAGLNKSSAATEAEQAAKVAKIAGVSFKKILFKSPAQVFPDNPFKNQLVLAMLLDIGAHRGIKNYAAGSDWTTPIEDAAVGFTITDAAEIYKEFWRGVQKHFPEARLIFIDDSEKKYDRLVYLFKKQPAALDALSSCVSPLRFRAHLHEKNRKKYGVNLMSGRCGSCYKCAMEYILLVEAGLIEKNPAFYAHCFHTLATSKTAHRPELFAEALPLSKRIENLKNYGS